MNKMIFGMFLLFAGLLAVGFVSATSATWNIPSANDVINGTSFSINLTGNVSEDHAGTGINNITYVLDGTLVGYNDDNQTEGLFDLNGDTINTALVNDGGSLTFTANLFNDTQGEEDAGITSVTVTVDNTAPSAVTITAPSSVKRGGSLSISYTSVDTTSVSYSTSLADEEGTAVNTKSGSSVVYSSSDLDTQGAYTVTVTATDGAGYATTATQTVDVKSSTSTVPYQAIQQELGGDNSLDNTNNSNGNSGLSTLWIGVIVIGAAGLWVANQSGSGRRRKRKR